jgi:spore coat polysaccharide biosynthesis predicted glycosyltransferase SpsG
LQHSVLFVVHAGEGVGLGHLTRSLVAARSLVLRLGAQVDFVAVGQKIDDTIAKEFKVDFSVIDGPIDVVLDHVTKNNHYAAICLDLFNPMLVESLAGVLETLRKAGSRIVAIDSLLGFEGLTDLLFVPSFLVPTYHGADRLQGRLAYGWDAYLLNVLPQDQTRDPSGSILVLTGGSDVTRLGRELPTILDERLPRDSMVHWVTGPFSERPIFPSPSKVEFIEHVAPAGLSALMVKAEIAITVFGVSFFELIALGVPTVVFSPYGEKNSRELREIAQHRIALVARDAQDAVEKATMLLGDSELRAELSNNARDKLKNFDGEYFSEELRIVLAE